MAKIEVKMDEQWRTSKDKIGLVPDGRKVLVKLPDGRVKLASYDRKKGFVGFYRKGIPIVISWWHEIRPENYTVELCPECGEETVVFVHGITPCQHCGCPVLPCSVCNGCGDCELEKLSKENGGVATNREILKKEASIAYAVL